MICSSVADIFAVRPHSGHFNSLMLSVTPAPQLPQLIHCCDYTELFRLRCVPFEVKILWFLDQKGSTLSQARTSERSDSSAADWRGTVLRDRLWWQYSHANHSEGQSRLSHQHHPGCPARSRSIAGFGTGGRCGARGISTHPVGRAWRFGSGISPIPTTRAIYRRLLINAPVSWLGRSWALGGGLLWAVPVSVSKNLHRKRVLPVQ